MHYPDLIFELKGYPNIRIWKESFQIKAQDHWEYRTFYFEDIKSIRFYDPNDNWWTKLILAMSWRNRMLSEVRPYRYLDVIKHNGGKWRYVTPGAIDPKFFKVFGSLQKRVAEVSEQKQ